MLSSQRVVASCASVVRCEVMWMKWPAAVPGADRLDGPGVRLGGEDAGLAVGLGDADVDLLGPQPRDGPGELGVVRQVDAEAALGDRRELVPVVVERGVDVDRDAQGASRLERRAERLSGCPRTGPQRSVPAGSGRDLRRRRRRRVDGDRLARDDAAGGGGRACGERGRHGRRQATAAVDPRPRRHLAELAAEHPGVHGHAPVRGDRPSGLRRLRGALGRDLDPRPGPHGGPALRSARASTSRW